MVWYKLAFAAACYCFTDDMTTERGVVVSNASDRATRLSSPATNITAAITKADMASTKSYTSFILK
jgi:hypothetical protein